MRYLPFEEREFKNYTQDVNCPHCVDYLVVYMIQQPPYGEEMAPCPYCERGYRLEFGYGKSRDGKEFRSANPPWGAEGFWRGREVPVPPESRLGYLGQRQPIPEWVHVWAWLRRRGDQRALPQQLPGYQAVHTPGEPVPVFLDNSEYEALLGEWLLAGSPKMNKLPGTA